MSMASWIHKYPRVQALLQDEDEALLYAPQETVSEEDMPDCAFHELPFVGVVEGFDDSAISYQAFTLSAPFADIDPPVLPIEAFIEDCHRYGKLLNTWHTAGAGRQIATNRIEHGFFFNATSGVYTSKQDS